MQFSLPSCLKVSGHPHLAAAARVFCGDARQGEKLGGGSDWVSPWTFAGQYCTSFDTAFFEAPGMALAQSYSCPASQKNSALARPQAACRKQTFAPTVGSWLGGGPNKGALFEVISPLFLEARDEVRGSPDSAHICDVVSCRVASPNPKIPLGTTDGLPS